MDTYLHNLITQSFYAEQSTTISLSLLCLRSTSHFHVHCIHPHYRSFICDIGSYRLHKPSPHVFWFYRTWERNTTLRKCNGMHISATYYRPHYYTLIRGGDNKRFNINCDVMWFGDIQGRERTASGILWWLQYSPHMHLPLSTRVSCWWLIISTELDCDGV